MIYWWWWLKKKNRKRRFIRFSKAMCFFCSLPITKDRSFQTKTRKKYRFSYDRVDNVYEICTSNLCKSMTFKFCLMIYRIFWWLRIEVFWLINFRTCASVLYSCVLRDGELTNLDTYPHSTWMTVIDLIWNFLIVDVLKIKYLFFLENLSSVQKTQELNLGTVLLLIITARLYKRQYTKLF